MRGDILRIRRRSNLLVSIAAVILLDGAIVRAEFETPTAITNARIVTSPGIVIESGTIVISKGRIVSVGSSVEVPARAEIFDATDLIVYPGFIDANTHAGIKIQEPDGDQLERLADDQPDTKEDIQSATVEAYRRLMHPHWRAEELFDPKTAERENHRKAGFTTAVVSPKIAIFSGRSAVINMGVAPLRRSVLKAGFAQHVAFVTGRKRGQFPAKPRYPTTTMGAMAAFRQILLDSHWHRELTAWSDRHPEEERVPLDRDLEALWDVLDRKTPVAFLANSENEIHRALDMSAEFELKPIIVGGREGWKLADRLKRDHVPVIVSLDWSEEPKAPEAADDGHSSENKSEKSMFDRTPIFDEQWQNQAFEPEKLFEERKRLWGEEVDNALRLHESGVQFCLGSYELKTPKDVLDRLRKAIDRGLSEEAALAALTRDAAAVFGLNSVLGEIVPGRLANLTLMTESFSEKNAKVKWVFVEGKPLSVNIGDQPNRKKKEAEEDEENKEEVTTQTAASQPTTSQAEDVVVWPEYACETEADRKPRVQTGGNLLIKNATLLTITEGDLVEADLLIEDGRITALGGDIPAPPGMTTVDLSGYCVMPSIIDAHSHMCTDGGLNEFSLSVTPEVRVREVVDHTDIGAFRALAGGVTTIHTMHGSANTIGGQNVVLRLKYGRPAAEWHFVEAAETIKFALGENVKQSNSRNRRTRFPNTRMGVEAVMRRSLDWAKQYKLKWKSYEEEKANGRDPRPIRRDLRLEALAAVHDGDIWVHCHCYRADEVLRLMEIAEDYGFRIGVLQHILEGYRVIPEIYRHGCTASTFSDWWAYKLEAYDAIPHNAARMVQGGIVTTVNSDSAEVIRHLNLEAAKSMRFGGLSPNDALKLITLNAAIQLGIDKYVGSIETGKFADLAVFDGHPLDTFSKCVLTLIDGEVYFQHESLAFKEPPTPLAVKHLKPPRPPLQIELSASGEYWIVGATIHPVSGPPIEDGLLVISDGKIEDVSPRRGRTPSQGATVISASDLHVYPGLINAGVPLGLTEISSVAGSMDVEDSANLSPDLTAVSAYNPFASAIEVARSEGVTSAMIPPAGNIVDGLAGLVRLDGWSMPEAMIASPVGLFVTLPTLPVRFQDWVTEEDREKRKKNYRETLAKTEAFFRRAGHYARTSAITGPTGRSFEFDRKLEAMIPYMRGEASVFFRANSYKQIKEALRFAERYELRPVIFGGREAWKLANELADKRIDVILVRSMAYPSDKFEPWDSVYRNASVLHRSSVRFCFATRGASLAKQLGIEAGMAVAYGLEPVHAMRALTLDAARILGVDDRLGSLEPGKVADVIITTDSPLQATNCVVASFINGRPVDLSNKHTRLDEKFRSRPTPNLPPALPLRGPPQMRLTETTR